VHQQYLENVRADSRLYLRLVGARIRAQMQYRVSFITMTFVTMLGLFTEFLTVLILLNRFEVLAGWEVGEVALLYGIASISFGLCELISSGFDVFPRAIRQGEFDQVLTRPASTFIQVMAAEFNLRRFGRIIHGMTAFGIGVYWTSINWSAGKILYLAMVFGSGAIMFTALIVLGATLCFWTVQSIELINIVTHGGNEMTSYPLPIYHVLMQRFFTVVVPLAFVSYYPALYVLDRPELATTPGWMPFMPPIAAAGMLLVSRIAWGFGVRHYRSTGT
jgi:ABC-2 type transport system permease protein